MSVFKRTSEEQVTTSEPAPGLWSQVPLESVRRRMFPSDCDAIVSITGGVEVPIPTSPRKYALPEMLATPVVRNVLAFTVTFGSVARPVQFGGATFAGVMVRFP